LAAMFLRRQSPSSCKCKTIDFCSNRKRLPLGLPLITSFGMALTSLRFLFLASELSIASLLISA
jgi:hypothetical protein